MEIGAILNLCVILLGLGVVAKGLAGRRQLKFQNPFKGLSLKLPSLGRKGPEGDSALEVLGSVSFGLRERVVLLGVGQRRFLLALNRGEFSLLSAFEEGTKEERPEPAVVKSLPERRERQQEQAFPFPLDGEPEDGWTLRPLSEVMKRIEEEFPFLRQAG